MAHGAPWTPFGEYDPTQRETINPFLPVEDLVLVFDPFGPDSQAAHAEVSPLATEQSSSQTQPPAAAEAMPKPIDQWQTAEFITPPGAKSWRPTPPCVSGVARQSSDTPGKLWVERRQKRRLLKAQREQQQKQSSAVTVAADPFRRLSDDLLCRICANLDVSEILRLCLLNRQWARVGASGTLWQQLYLRNMPSPERFGILHFSFDRTQVWKEEPAPKYWRRIYLSRVRELASALRQKSLGWKPFAKSEVWVDVIEKLRMHVAVSGRVLSAEVTGVVTAECHLPDQAALCELKINFVDSEQVPRVVLDDVTFHSCVDVGAFANATEPRVLFRPPSAGSFEVMRYKVLTQKLRVPFTVEAIYMKDLDKHSYEVSVTIKSNFKANTKLVDVVVHVPVPPASYVKTVTKVSGGEATYQTRGNEIIWRIGSVSGSKAMELTSTVQIPKGEALEWTRPPLELECQPFLYNLSGLRCLGFLLPERKDLKTHNWVRYTAAVASFKHDV